MGKLTDDVTLESLAAFHEGSRVVAPTSRWFRDRLGLSSTSVADYRLHRLADRGWIERMGAFGTTGPYSITDAGRAALAERRA